jgi:hypothetical protein
MAVYDSSFSPDLSKEAMEEYLTIAEYCLIARKGDSGAYGYPAALLLLCIVNALGVYLEGENVRIDGKDRKITRGEPFYVLNHLSLGLDEQLTQDQIKYVERALRNRLAHNVMLAPGSYLNAEEDSDAVVFEGATVEVRLKPLLRAVRRAWKSASPAVDAWLTNPDRRHEFASQAKALLRDKSANEVLLPTPTGIVAATGSPFDPRKFIREM